MAFLRVINVVSTRIQVLEFFFQEKVKFVHAQFFVGLVSAVLVQAKKSLG